MKKLFVLLLVGVILLLSGCASNRVAGRNELALEQLSAQQEIALGEQAFSLTLQRMGGSYPDHELNSYVAEVGRRITRNNHRTEFAYSFKVLNDSTPNAFALPGGFIAVTRGLLLDLHNEAQLAAVLAHQIGHVTARHSLREMQRSPLLKASIEGSAGVVADSAVLETLLNGASTGLSDKRYSREQEREADRLGIDYMVRAGYAPQGAIELQELFYRKIETDRNPGWLKGLSRNHPFSVQRLDATRSYVAEYYTGTSGDGLDGRRYRQAIARLQETVSAYRLYDEARRLEREGQLDVAIQTYHKAIQQVPEHALLLNDLGMAYLRKEDYIPARRYLIKSVNQNPDYFQSRLGLGYISLYKDRQPAAAAEQLRASLQLLPTVQASYLLAEAEELQDHLAVAAELYRVVARAEPRGRLGQAARAALKRLEQ